METPHTLEPQVIGEIDRRRMERDAAAAGEPVPAAIETEAPGEAPATDEGEPVPAAIETEAPGEAPATDEGDPK